MSKILVDTPEKKNIIIGIVTGVIGLLTCILNYPIYSYLKYNKNNQRQVKNLSFFTKI